MVDKKNKIKILFGYFIEAIIITLFVLATLLIIFSHNIIDIISVSDIIDTLSISLIPIVIIVIFKVFLNFKDGIYLDNISQIWRRYIIIMIIYIYTKCILRIINYEDINLNSSCLLVVWLNFLFIGYYLFLKDRRNNSILKCDKNLALIDKIRIFILNNKDSDNLYSFIIKFIPFIILTIIQLHFFNEIINENIKLYWFQYILIEFIRFSLPISTMIYGSILMIGSFLEDESK